jgi:hypothetical protein
MFGWLVVRMLSQVWFSFGIVCIFTSGNNTVTSVESKKDGQSYGRHIKIENIFLNKNKSLDTGLSECFGVGGHKSEVAGC